MFHWDVKCSRIVDRQQQRRRFQGPSRGAPETKLISNVAGVVTLLNNLLGVVTGLLGGLAGGLGGIA